MKFTLTIELGNEAMNHPRDVAYALRRIGAGLDNDDWQADHLDVGAAIFDANGNTVGRWEVSR